MVLREHVVFLGSAEPGSLELSLCDGWVVSTMVRSGGHVFAVIEPEFSDVDAVSQAGRLRLLAGSTVWVNPSDSDFRFAVNVACWANPEDTVLRDALTVLAAPDNSRCKLFHCTTSANVSHHHFALENG